MCGMENTYSIQPIKRTVVDIQATSKLLKSLRIQNGYTVKQLQEIFGFETPVAVYAWENEKSKNIPCIENLDTLSKLYNCHVEDLYVLKQVDFSNLEVHENTPEYGSSAKSNIHYFIKDEKYFKGIQYLNKRDLNLIKQEFGDLFIEDPYEFQQIQIPSKSGEIPVALTINDELTMVEDIEEASKLLIVRVGTSVYDNVDKKYKDDYKKTLYVFHNDWIMFSLENKELFVVDENYIYQWKEIPEKLIK